MTSPHWPLTGLVLRTPRIDLRWPTLADLDALATLAAEGIHDPAVQPFSVPWTDAPPADRARGTLQYHWQLWGSWQPADWRLALVAVLGGTVTGMQEVAARDFAALREVSTGSWLGRGFQGQGIGTHMRAAVLALAFEGLSAEYATSEAFPDNLPSSRVSQKLGYTEDGCQRLLVRGAPVRATRYRLDRASWQAHRAIPVEILGLAPCLPCFGLAPAGGAAMAP
jgi:RimJ/RimL family protein N-acetyltransferase